MRSLMRLPARAIVVLAIVLPATSAAQPRYDQLRVIAPAAPGGGWDQTARAMQQALQREGIARLAPVENIPGAAGTIGLARFMGAERGSSDAVMVSGLIMLGGIVTNRSPVTLADVVPIARLTGEYKVIAVPAASPLRSLQDLLTAFKARPESISWGGGSAGGSDQILAGLVADAVGVDPRRINYIAFAGGGESLSAILGGQVSVGINGLAEFAPQLEAGTLRALAISSADRLPGLDVPTLREQGVAVDFENWRSVVAPTGHLAVGPATARGGHRGHGALRVVARVARSLSVAGPVPGGRRLCAVCERGGSPGSRHPEKARDRRRRRGNAGLGRPVPLVRARGVGGVRVRRGREYSPSTTGREPHGRNRRTRCRLACAHRARCRPLSWPGRTGRVRRGVDRALLAHGARV